LGDWSQEIGELRVKISFSLARPGLLCLMLICGARLSGGAAIVVLKRGRRGSRIRVLEERAEKIGASLIKLEL